MDVVDMKCLMAICAMLVVSAGCGVQPPTSGLSTSAMSSPPTGQAAQSAAQAIDTSIAGSGGLSIAQDLEQILSSGNPTITSDTVWSQGGDGVVRLYDLSKGTTEAIQLSTPVVGIDKDALGGRLVTTVGVGGTMLTISAVAVDGTFDKLVEASSDQVVTRATSLRVGNQFFILAQHPSGGGVSFASLLSVRNGKVVDSTTTEYGDLDFLPPDSLLVGGGGSGGHLLRFTIAPSGTFGDSSDLAAQDTSNILGVQPVFLAFSSDGHAFFSDSTDPTKLSTISGVDGSKSEVTWEGLAPKETASFLAGVDPLNNAGVMIVGSSTGAIVQLNGSSATDTRKGHDLPDSVGVMAWGATASTVTELISTSDCRQQKSCTSSFVEEAVVL